MSEGRPAVIQAHFVGFKHVPSRQAAQLIFELAAEAGQDALNTLGGLPSAANPPWVAIARINVAAKQKEPPVTETSLDQQGKEAVIAAGILARNPDYQKWRLKDAFDPSDPKANAEAAAQAIREDLNVQSRTEIRTVPGKLQQWRTHVARFVAETKGAAA